MKYIFYLPITLYQYLISPWFGNNCRYFPTCSHYTKEAIQRHGALKGCILGAKRICSCHPFCKKDMDDPVPERIAWRELFRYKKPSKK